MDPAKGHFLTVDPFYNPETFQATKPKFKKISPKFKQEAAKPQAPVDKSKSRHKRAVKEEPEVEPIPEFVSQVRHIDLAAFKTNNPEEFDKVLRKTLSLFAEGEIKPYLSKTYSLSEVNKAVKFISQKKCIGKVLIDVQGGE